MTITDQLAEEAKALIGDRAEVKFLNYADVPFFNQDEEFPNPTAAVAAAFDKKEGRTGVNAPTFQFMRVGYFCLDNRDSTAEHLVFNRSVSLKDSFKK